MVDEVAVAAAAAAAAAKRPAVAAAAPAAAVACGASLVAAPEMVLFTADAVVLSCCACPESFCRDVPAKFVCGPGGMGLWGGGGR